MGALSVQNEALQGINRGLEGMRKSAAEIASADQLNKSGQETDLARSLLDMQQSQVQVQASAKVVSAVDEVLGTLIDIRA